MLKENKWKLLVSSILIMLPALVGLILWDRLPEIVPIHWGINGKPDGWGSRAMAVFALPTILLVIHWAGMLFTAKDHSNRQQSKKVFGIIFWICPVISIAAFGSMYAIGMGESLNMARLMPLLLGAAFVVIGNLMPKCRRNSTIGIKVKWALENEENWNATHRMGGRVWVAGGLLLMLGVFLPAETMLWVMFPGLMAVAIIPAVYSYVYYRKQLRNGTVVKTSVDPKRRTVHWILIIITALLLFVLLFTGEIRVTCGDARLTVDNTFYSDQIIEYKRIEKIEYREACDPGVRANGFGSPRLLMGIFENEEFGLYIRYSYTKCDACVLLTVDDEIYAIGCETAEETEKLYEQIAAKLKS